MFEWKQKIETTKLRSDYENYKKLGHYEKTETIMNNCENYEDYDHCGKQNRQLDNEQRKTEDFITHKKWSEEARTHGVNSRLKWNIITSQGSKTKHKDKNTPDSSRAWKEGNWTL